MSATNITVSRNAVLVTSTGVVILLCAFIIVLFKLLSEPSPPPPRPPLPPLIDNSPLIPGGIELNIPEGVQQKLREEGYVSISLINGFGQVKIVGLAGNQKAPCGQMKGVVVPFEECGLTGIDLQTINQITIFRGRKNPVCIWANVSGTLTNLGHADALQGRWNIGHDPCHSKRSNGNPAMLQHHHYN